MDLPTHKVLESRDVVFHEDIFHFDKQTAHQPGVLFPFYEVADDDGINMRSQPGSSLVMQESLPMP